MSVSNEDRTAALDVIILGVDWAGLIYPPSGRDRVLDLRDLARQALEALISHGWGPRPTVTRKEIDGWVLQAANHPLTVANGIADYLRECGIEVAK